MNAQGILDRIERDAREAAAQTLREARIRGEALQAQSDKRIAQGRDAAMEHARQEALLLDDRMQRMARLDARKERLAAKRAVLDEAFEKALSLLTSMPEAEARSFGLRMLSASAHGDETLIPDEASSWCDQAFVDAANDALRKAGKPGDIKLSAERRALGGGFVLKRGGMEINCSFRAALDAARMDVEAEAAALLFDE